MYKQDFFIFVRMHPVHILFIWVFLLLIHVHCFGLMLYITFFRSVVTETRVEFKRFNKQAYLDSKSGGEKSFYEKVMKTSMFKKFLKDRINDKTDYWVKLEVKTRPQTKTSESGPCVPNRYVCLCSTCIYEHYIYWNIIITWCMLIPYDMS